MADLPTMALRQADAWVPCDNDDGIETSVGLAIERWHVERDIAIPADAEFVAATWSIPAGTTMNWWSDAQAEKLRVEMPCGNRYLIEIDREGGGGDDGQSECVYVNVRHASIGRRGELVGACVMIVVFFFLMVFA